MTDEFDEIRRLRPDHGRPDDPFEPTVFTRHKEELMKSITPDTPPPETSDAPPDDWVNPSLALPDIYPRLAYDDERAALDYLVRVFQLDEIREARAVFDEHMLAWVRCGNGVVMIGHANTEVHQISSPRTVGATTVEVVVYVPDIDAHHAHAAANGAVVTSGPVDMFYGERRYEATDPEGHRWHFAERHAHIRARGGTVAEA